MIGTWIVYQYVYFWNSLLGTVIYIHITVSTWHFKCHKIEKELTPIQLSRWTIYKQISGRKQKFFEGDIVITKSMKNMMRNHQKRGAATTNENHIWPVNNGKHEIPYVISEGKLIFKSKWIIYCRCLKQ